MNDINSLKVRLSDIQQKSESKWTSDNVVVKEEKGDLFYKHSDDKEAFLQREFEKHEAQMKEIREKLEAEESKPLIYDSNGQVVDRGDQPNFTQENVSVAKDATGQSDESMKTLENLGQELSAKQDKTSPKAIKDAMKIKPQQLNSDGHSATIGTFNLDWLGTRKRTEDDYKEIAQVIKDTGAQLLGIEEVSNEDGLKKVASYLPDYGYILGKSGGQRIAVPFDKKRVKYDVNSIDQITDAQVGARLRAPLLVDMKLDDKLDFTFVVAHTKAMMDNESMATRKEQAQKIDEWINKHIKDNPKKDVIFVGDLNDTWDSDSLKPLDGDKKLHFLTEGADFFSNIPYKGLIDHCVVTNEAGTLDHVVPGSIHTIDHRDYPHYVKSVSDHKPVVFTINEQESK